MKKTCVICGNIFYAHRKITCSLLCKRERNAQIKTAWYSERCATTQVELAEILGVNRKTIQRWLKHDDAPETKSDGRYDLAEWREFKRLKSKSTTTTCVGCGRSFYKLNGVEYIVNRIMEQPCFECSHRLGKESRSATGLGDKYVLNTISPNPSVHQFIPQEMIEAKRSVLKIKRLVRQSTNTTTQTKGKQ